MASYFLSVIIFLSSFSIPTILSLSSNCNNGACTPLSTTEKQQILDLHNELRDRVAGGGLPGHPSATNMNHVIWDDGLENVAQNYVESCPGLNHNSNRQTAYKAQRDSGNIKWGPDSGGYSSIYVGENLAVSGSYAMSNILSQIETGWYDEWQDWTFGNHNSGCSGVACGHYTQMVWANTRYIGCGYTNGCSSGGWAGIFLCNYFPAGNFNSIPPYEQGTACTNCMSDRTECKSDYVSQSVAAISYPAQPYNALCDGGACPTMCDGGSYSAGTCDGTGCDGSNIDCNDGTINKGAGRDICSAPTTSTTKTPTAPTTSAAPTAPTTTTAAPTKNPLSGPASCYMLENYQFSSFNGEWQYVGLYDSKPSYVHTTGGYYLEWISAWGYNSFHDPPQGSTTIYGYCEAAEIADCTAGTWYYYNGGFILDANAAMTPCPPTPTTTSPSTNPSVNPTRSPSSKPTTSPTIFPSANPTTKPTDMPTKKPTPQPTDNPIRPGTPTKAPTNPTPSPSTPPTISPTNIPTASPTKSPTNNPSKTPTKSPTHLPTDSPITSAPTTTTAVPTKNPVSGPASCYMLENYQFNMFNGEWQYVGLYESKPSYMHTTGGYYLEWISAWGYNSLHAPPQGSTTIYGFCDEAEIADCTAGTWYYYNGGFILDANAAMTPCPPSPTEVATPSPTSLPTKSPTLNPNPSPTRNPNANPTAVTNAPTTPTPTMYQTCCGCITAEGVAGCAADIPCQTEVCDADSYCCGTEWDTICAAAANRICTSSSASFTLLAHFATTAGDNDDDNEAAQVQNSGSVDWILYVIIASLVLIIIGLLIFCTCSMKKNKSSRKASMVNMSAGIKESEMLSADIKELAKGVVPFDAEIFGDVVVVEGEGSPIEAHIIAAEPIPTSPVDFNDDELMAFGGIFDDKDGAVAQPSN